MPQLAAAAIHQGLADKVLQVRVPGERHEDVRSEEHQAAGGVGGNLHSIDPFDLPGSAQASSPALERSQLRRNLQQRLQHERSFVHARMRERQAAERRSWLRHTASRSRSSVRGALGKLRLRPWRASISCSSASRRSAGRPVSSWATALMKSGCVGVADAARCGRARTASPRGCAAAARARRRPGARAVRGSSRLEPMPT